MIKAIKKNYQFLNFNSAHPLWLNTVLKTDAIEHISYTLLNHLQTTVDPEILLAIFYQQVSQYLPLCNIRFVANNVELKVLMPNTDGYCISQRLAVNGKSLGCFKCYFTDKPRIVQVRLLKKLAKVLCYPLHNAIQYQQVKHMALTDNLTGLANRNQFETTFQHLVSCNKEKQTSFSLLVIDLDGFKTVNDQFGHQTGDLVLCSFAKVLLDCCREQDKVFRFGGDEFTILLHDTNIGSVPRIALRISKLMHACQFLAKFGLSCSIGSALYQRFDESKQLFGRADQALYRAKGKGKNCLEMSPCSQ
jgi:diguanylate cyclase (GGDEF)-like protein